MKRSATCSRDIRAMIRVARSRACRSEEHTSELQSQSNLVCRLLLEKKKHTQHQTAIYHNNLLKSQARHITADEHRSAEHTHTPPYTPKFSQRTRNNNAASTESTMRP